MSGQGRPIQSHRIFIGHISRALFACAIVYSSVSQHTLVADELTNAAFDATFSETEPHPQQDDGNLNDVRFVGSKTGWAVGDHGVIWKTVDAGRNWQFVAAPVDCALRSVCFLTDRVGWIVGGGTSPYTHIDFGVVLATTDGGQTWQHLAQQQLPQLHYVRFFTIQQGVAVGAATPRAPTGVYSTNDGGQTWSAIDGPGQAGWRTAEFLNPEVGAVAGLEGKVALVGGGRLLQPRIGELGLRGLRDIALNRDDTGWMVGDGGLVLWTENGGVVWQAAPQPLPKNVRETFEFRAVAAQGSSVWLAGLPGSMIWHSPDGGRNWVKQYTGQPQPINAISFTSEMNGVAVGTFGSILITEDAGRNWHAVRGADRRAALLSLHARPSDVSMGLLAKLSGELGYRSVAKVLPRRDLGPDGHLESDGDLRLHEAVLTAGGSAAETGWRLPIDIPDIDKHSARLTEEWNRRTEGRLADVLVGEIVRDLRTWRPNVVIIQEPAVNDETTRLLNQAIIRALEVAADPTQFVHQFELAGLQPWHVTKTYLKQPVGNLSDTDIDTHELLPRLGKTVETVAAAAYGRINADNRTPQLRESYRLLVDSGRANTLTNSAGGFFTGIALPSGSPARRKLLPFDESQAELKRKIARQQRNLQAYTERYLDNPQKAASLIGEIPQMVAGLPDEQAAAQLSKLADEYRRQSNWDLVEATLVELVERYPAEPVTAEAMRWLFQFWSSSETAWQRTRRTQVLGSEYSVDSGQVLKRIQQAAHAAQLPEGERDKIVLAAGSDPLSVTHVDGQIKTGDNDSWRRGAVRNWHQQALQMARMMQQRAPGLYTTPEMEFALASLLRERGSFALADRLYQNYVRTGSQDPWKQAADGEIWLSRPVEPSPNPAILCRFTAMPPLLDGILSEECWQHASEIVLTSPETTDSTAGPTAMVMLSYDAEHLYLAASIPRRPGTSKALPVYEGRTFDADLSEYDRLNLFLDIDRDYSSYYALHVDQRAWTAESCFADVSWNPQWFVAADADDKQWRIEVAIPFKELTARPPLRGATWAVGITRIIPAIGLESWTHPAGTQPRPEAFGLVKFE